MPTIGNEYDGVNSPTIMIAFVLLMAGAISVIFMMQAGRPSRVYHCGNCHEPGHNVTTCPRGCSCGVRHVSRQCPNPGNSTAAVASIDEFVEADVVTYTSRSVFGERCCHCQAWLFANETASSSRPCCNNGQVVMDQLPSIDRELLQLFVCFSPEALYFREHIRAFNSAMAFSSFLFNDPHDLLPGGPPTFRIHGTTHHRIGPLNAESGEPARFLQIYFLDHQMRQQRWREVVGLGDSQYNERIMDIIETCIRRDNIYFRMFHTAVERQRAAAARGEPLDAVVQLRLLDGDGIFALPSSDNIAAIIGPVPTDMAFHHCV